MQTTKYEVHPAAAIFPMMPASEFVEFKEDIAQNGVREPIVLLDGKLIDGRNRLQACTELGIDPLASELEEDTDPVAYVMSANLHRRQLSTSQRAMCAAKLATLKNGSNQHTKEGPQNCGPITAEEASIVFRVSARSVETARDVIRDGSSELLRLVEHDELKVSTACRFIREIPDKREQTKIAKQGATAVRDVVKSKPKKERAPVSVPAVDSVKEFQALWARCSKIQQSAIRAFILSDE